ncbi:MAG: hypothetical protein E7402_01630 [Ruminococcaceae bacterium]|nr:hypothetical protein [Oscillospiraceae bacterium]
MYTVDYGFYSDCYGGTEIPQEVFDRFSYRAGVLLDNMLCVQKGAEEEAKIQHVLCEICDRLYREDRHFGIERESMDGYDVTYRDEVANDIQKLVRQTLGTSGMLYRGRGI